MNQESENNKKLKDFFSDEYQSLKSYISYRIKGNGHRDADDIIQDVALKLFSTSDRYGPINNIAGFVYRSVRNKIIDTMRANKPTESYEDKFELKLHEFVELMYESADNTYSEELKINLKKSIQKLKPQYRSVIRAVDFEGYSYKELSEETGTPLGTLMSQRHRAISLLYKDLELNKIL
jgi:RNA polymerase sigma-70 factor (ECF subfamily)